MFEYRAIWNVQGGGTGYSVFHVRESGLEPDATSAQLFATDLRAGFNAIVSILPDDVIINFDSEARFLNVTTGQLESVESVTAPATVTGTSTAVYAAPAGARVDLVTEGIVAGRRVRGRTYVVPLVSSAFTTTGTVTSAARTTLNNAFELFRDDVGHYSLAVWSRTHGFLADVTSVSTPSESAILRSRRE